MNKVAEDILMHYGVSKMDGAPGRGSGRYPLGSGENPNQHSGDFVSRVKKMRKEGFTWTDPDTGETFKGDTAIAKSLNLSTTQFRAYYALAKNEERSAKVAKAKELQEKGLTRTQIAEEMGYNSESSIRSLLNENAEARMDSAKVTADYLREAVNKKGMIDVGAGVERECNVSKEKFDQALELLKAEGYEVYGGGVPQATNPGRQTNLKVLCPPGTQHKDIYNFEDVHSLKDYDKILVDNGREIRKAFEYPASMDSKRLAIRYAEDGGEAKDGVIEIRRGVKDLSLGDSHYAQVRILVDGTHYLKGMAIYSDNLPDGVDVMFNTNKKKGTPALGPKDHSVLKQITDDPKNPFGSLIKEVGGQSYYEGDDGKEHLSLINKRGDEGDWGDWKNKLPSQFLAKQDMKLINNQLNLSIADKKMELEEIRSLTNPTVKKELLKSFADDCDSAAVHLQGASLPRQSYQVILPLTTINDNEVYAPNYRDGERVALVRFPHEGTYQIPICKVNNKVQEGKDVIGTNPKDAIGITKATADRLSGADFDGDTVMVIPLSDRVKVQSTPPLKDLEGFDAKDKYGPGSTSVPYKRMNKGAVQKEMGTVSNLLSDMTQFGATEKELAWATMHNMVVIDAYKHNLDYKRSEKENHIAELKRKYQGHIGEDGKYHEGAATIISRAKSQRSVPKRQGSPIINEDGSVSWKTADNLTYVNKKGKVITRTQKSNAMMETSDAMTLVSNRRTPVELAYANYANNLKAMANSARKEMINTGRIEYSPSANKVYKKEADSLDSRLNLALKNAPRERTAQIMTKARVDAIKQDNPAIEKKELKKIAQRELTSARIRVGALRQPIKLSDREWEAIQSGAISENKLRQIIKYVDGDDLRKRATPRTAKTMTPAKINKLQAMKASGYTNQEIADALGVSVSTVNKYKES